jgi:dTDP-4-dehydrorhamnose reductase
VQLAVQRVLPIASSDYPTPAKRPFNSRLSCEKIARVLGVKMPAWQDGLNDCMKKKYASH